MLTVDLEGETVVNESVDLVEVETVLESAGVSPAPFVTTNSSNQIVPLYHGPGFTFCMVITNVLVICLRFRIVIDKK